jgi:selenocysteine lyase/cysteine desulfurase
MDQNGNFTLIPAARRFEFGTRALATFAGFDAALHWNEDIGIDRIIDRIDFLVDFAIREWSERGYKISSPINKKQRSGVFVLKLPENCNGWDVYNEMRLNKNTYTSPVDEPRDLRVAIHFFNTRDEIKKLFNLISAYCKK